MGILSLDRHVVAEVLDARGGLVVTTGSTRLHAVLRDVPELFVEGAQLAMHIQIGADRFEALCKVTGDELLPCAPGTSVVLEVLRAAPAGISNIDAFDLVPLTPPDANELTALARPPHGGSPTPPFGSLPPQAAFDDEEDEPTGVVGTLREMPVTEIVQSLAQTHKDALVEVKPKGTEVGTIGVERGRVVYARVGAKLGEAAFFHLLQADRGAFRIRYGRTAPSRNIDRDTTFLLLEGARLVDEERSRRPVKSAPGDSARTPMNVLGMGIASLPSLVPTPAGDVADPFARPTPSGLFSRFFDEAGVQTPPEPLPLPQETQRFHSLQVEIGDVDDEDRIDTDRTTRERRRPGAQASDTPA